MVVKIARSMCLKMHGQFVSMLCARLVGIGSCRIDLFAKIRCKDLWRRKVEVNISLQRSMEKKDYDVGQSLLRSAARQDEEATDGTLCCS